MRKYLLEGAGHINSSPRFGLLWDHWLSYLMSLNFSSLFMQNYINNICLISFRDVWTAMIHAKMLCKL